MRSLLSVALIVVALSLCNLMGRRSNTNANTNTPPSGTNTETASTENSNAATPQQTPPPLTIGSGLPPAPRNQNSSAASKNSNMAAPPTISAGPPGVATMPSTNRNSAASVPSAPTVPRAPISGGVLNGKAIRLVQPPYPAIARAAHASGQVTVRVLVDEAGNVVSATPVSGHPLLQPSAVAAARASKFSPTLLSGQPVKVSGVIIYNFVAQ